MASALASTTLVSAQSGEEHEEPLERTIAPAAPTGEDVPFGAPGEPTDPSEVTATGEAHEEQGLGTDAAEKERMHRSRGEVGKSVAVTPADEERELQFHFHGYYRARYNWIGNAPIFDVNSSEPFRSKNASYGYMRLRLDPEVTYGPDPKKPVARLRFTVDGLDNVVFGDNARVIGIPLFAMDQSKTDVNGFDISDSLRLSRAWIEFLIPVGQIAVGRMESHWATGIQSHAGNGLAEWGDFLAVDTYDRDPVCNDADDHRQGHQERRHPRHALDLCVRLRSALARPGTGLDHPFASGRNRPELQALLHDLRRALDRAPGVSNQSRPAHERDRQRPRLARRRLRPRPHRRALCGPLRRLSLAAVDGEPNHHPRLRVEAEAHLQEQTSPGDHHGGRVLRDLWSQWRDIRLGELPARPL